jgi:hypothetical protein
MALLWCDGFEHYGLDESKMLDGVYLNAGITLTTAHASTGTTSVYVGSDAAGSIGNSLRKVIPAATTKMGVAARFYIPEAPIHNYKARIFDFMTSDSRVSHVAVVVDANGALRFYQGGNYTASNSIGTLLATTDPIIGMASWNHIEVQINVHDTLGWIRVAVNGQHRYASATNLDTKNGTDSILSVMTHQYYDGTGDSTDDFYMDDLYMYDFTGTAAVETDWCPTVDGSGVATNYMGEYDVVYLPPNGDTATAAFLKSTGTVGYQLIDETTPDDADYIYSTAAGDLSEFDLTDLDPKYTYIRGLQLLGRLSKTDSGAAQTQFGMHSASSTSDATARVITTIPTYWWDFMNVDPASSARWTRASLNAAKIRFTRSV